MIRIIAWSVAVFAATANAAAPVRSGKAAFGSWHDDAPGVVREFAPGDMPAPNRGLALITRSAGNSPRVVRRPDGVVPKVPGGFSVTLFASGLRVPRVLRVAPNGDLFLAENGAGKILVYKAGANGTPDGSNPSVFASGLDDPYGIAFYPAGNDPKYVYVGEAGKVVRYAYKSGDTHARSAPETIVSGVPEHGHSSRDVAVLRNGKILLAVGSRSNVAEDMAGKTVAQARAYDARHGYGASWGREERRAAVWEFAADGSGIQLYATGLRNCAGLGIQPGSGVPWCVVNERDRLGDNVPFDYATTIRRGAFYGWPWYYIGDHQDPRQIDRRPDLKNHVTVPDVLIQPHSAPLGIAFYDKTQFPAQYRGDAFVALHGSWNRSVRSGYKVVRLLMKNAKPTGAYADFMTGFVVDDDHVWGRPAGVAVALDGSLIVSEDGNGTLWRVTAKRGRRAWRAARFGFVRTGASQYSRAGAAGSCRRFRAGDIGKCCPIPDRGCARLATACRVGGIPTGSSCPVRVGCGVLPCSPGNVGRDPRRDRGTGARYVRSARRGAR